MRKVRTTCAQAVVDTPAFLSTTTPTLPHVEFTNTDLFTSALFIPTSSTVFPTIFTQLILSTNSSRSGLIPTIPRTNKDNNKGE